MTPQHSERTAMQPFDLVIRGGTVATATDSYRADVGIRGSAIAAIGKDLDKGKKEIDARGRLGLPGGVDSHSHIEQLSASGLMNADTFESATTAAAFGGTTTVISFAAQHVGMSLKTVVDEYHEYAKRGAVGARQSCEGLRARREPRHDLVDGQAPRQARLHGAEVPFDLASARV